MSTPDVFTTLRTEGGLLPSDLLQRIAGEDSNLAGLKPKDYHLVGSERLNEAVSRAWSRLIRAWSDFCRAREKLPESDLGTSPTRERWLLILFQELGYGRLPGARGADREIDGKSYPISHVWQNSPIHLVGFRVDLDRRTARVAGAARTSPHSLVQEFLNRSDRHLWAFLSNGLRLRILRDNVSLTRQAYVEFDLEGMMDGEVYADFALLWLLCHQSRVEGEQSEQCWLEKWTRVAQEEGTRVREHLRKGVEKAIKVLGSGFLAHPGNGELRDKLRSGTLPKEEYYRQLLRLVYRLIFLFVAEDRGLLFDPDADPEARERYMHYYSTQRLRNLAEKHRLTKHADLYRGLRVIMELLGSAEGCADLAIPALGSFLWSENAIPDLASSDISNRYLLEAIRPLAFTVEERTFRVVDYRNLGSEELGSVYESLLEMHPEINTDAATFDLTVAAGHERKTTGSYYTPTSLVNCLLDSALEPVIAEAAKKDNPEQTLLDLKICDPACGSGHFLIAAAHRLAKRLAAARTGDEEPSPEATRTALRDVIGHCIYGVDINPMAVELCKVSLWMEAIEPGRPLSFLDHHIQCGNSLIGMAPQMTVSEFVVPDKAFKELQGDDKDVARGLRKQNKDERKGQRWLDFHQRVKTYEYLAEAAQISDMPDGTVQEVNAQASAYHEWVSSTEYQYQTLCADAWTATFFWPLTKDQKWFPTQGELVRLIENPGDIPDEAIQQIAELSGQYQFFHWPVCFQDVFNGDSPGFDCVLGNPPWERVKLQEKEFFSSRNPEIAEARNAAARRRMIRELTESDPALSAEFRQARRDAECQSKFLRESACYPLCGRGDVNTYTIFAELKRDLLSPRGRVGCIVQSGIATDDTTKFFFRDLTETNSLVSLYDFENRKKIFPAIDSRMKFSLLTMAFPVAHGERAADFVFFAHQTTDLAQADRHFTLTAQEIALLNPNTRTCPIFRSKRDAELTKYIYRRVPVLIREGDPEGNPWGIEFATMFHMTNDSHLFRTREQLETEGFSLEGNIFRKGNETYLPMWEDWMMHHYEHRYQSDGALDTTTQQHQDPEFSVQPRVLG